MIARFACRSLRQSVQGGAAIEYALIASVIALGIIGSLITTKGSVNGVFGKIAGQVGSAMTTGQPSAMATYWANKGLVNTQKTLVTNQYGSSYDYVFTFADGSRVTASTQQSQPSNYWGIQFSASDAAMNQSRYEYYDHSGNLNYFQISNRYAGSTTNSDITQMYTGDYQPITGDPPQGTTVIRNTFNTSGSVTGTYSTAVPAFYSAAAQAKDESVYFASLMQ